VEFAERGAIVVLAARNEEKLKEVESLILSKNGIAFPVRADIRQEDDCKNLIERTIEKYGKLDVLITMRESQCVPISRIWICPS
jgi:NAD(P)-dependent dehydrogenase (short-subunit alcohol dehydrogenase family)